MESQENKGAEHDICHDMIVAKLEKYYQKQ